MKQRRDVYRLAKKLGAKIIENDPHDFEAEAPNGKRWKCDGVHWLVASLWDGYTMGELWTDLWGRMDFGLETCTETDCDSCHDY